MNDHQLAAHYGLTLSALRKRRRRGTPLDRPLQRRSGRLDHYCPPEPDPLNAVFREWRPLYTLAALGVRQNLKARI